MSPTNTSKNKLIMGLAIVLSLILGIWLSQYLNHYLNDERIPPDSDATVLPKARALQDFQLIDQDGKPFTLQQLKGQWSFLFFGFTRCPDVCPTTLHAMKQVWEHLPTKAGETGHPKLFFVSVDPDRDNLEMLKPFATFYHPEFIGVTGKIDQIDNLTRQLNILYGYDDKSDGSDSDYTVNHSAQVLLVDPQGRWRAVFSPPHEPTGIAKNFQQIREFYGD